MKIRLFSLLICLLIGFSLQAQKSKSAIQYVGLRTIGGLNNQFSQGLGGAHFGLNLEYSRSFKNKQHFWASGIGVNLSILKSQLTEEEFGQDLGDNILVDNAFYASIPIHYIYQPFSWLYLRSGFNNQFVVRNATTYNGAEDWREWLPDYRRYIFETHAALGFSLPIWRMKITLETYMSYPIFTNEYFQLGLNLGIYYKIKK
jgi:hypothetical protein